MDSARQARRKAITLSDQQEIIYAKFVNKVTQRGNAEEEKRRAGQMAKDGAGEVAAST